MTTATAKTQTAAFRPLQQNNANQAQCQDQVDDENDVFHVFSLGSRNGWYVVEQLGGRKGSDGWTEPV